MDSANTLWLDAIINDSLRKGSDRRGSTERPGYPLRTEMPEDVGFNEDTGDGVERRERMAQAMYDC
jgi:hypothetical protein